ncbi:MAG: hypothetical protein U0903_11590 [Planctomycetales bacterium]
MSRRASGYFASAHCRGRLLRLFALSLACGLLCAEEPGATTPKSEQPVSESPIGSHPPMLILKELGVVRGPITKGQFTYVVEKPGGQMIIPHRNVLFECRDIHEAYKLLKRGVSPDSAKDHVVLSRWCLANKLNEEAEEELKMAEDLDPESVEVMILSKHIQDLHAPAPAPEAYPEPEPRHVDLVGFPSVYVDPLADLPRHASLDYTRRIQPILMNNCSNSRCHGPEAKRPFTLSITRGTSHTRSRSEENLNALLKYVEPGDPKLSPVFSAHKDSKGKPTTPFDTPQSKPAERVVEEWIRSLTRPDEDPKKDTSPGAGSAAHNIVKSRERNRQRYLATQEKQKKQDDAAARRQKLADQLLDDDKPSKSASRREVVPAPLAVDAD